MSSQLEADLTAVELERRDMEEQLNSWRETSREDKENVRQCCRSKSVNIAEHFAGFQSKRI
jgi:hypothetical protein